MISYEPRVERPYKRWKNYGMPGETVFVTTTVLDFVPAFSSKCAKDAMVEELVAQHLASGAILHAYVIMSTHIHFLTKLPIDMDVSQFVKKVKIAS